MERSIRFRTKLALVVFLLTSASASAIFNGDQGTKKGVGFLKLGEAYCTAVVIKDRCVLTSAHCKDPRKFSLEPWYKNSGPHALVVRFDPQQEADNTTPDRDLQVLWMTKKKYGPNTSKDLGNADWPKAELDWSNGPPPGHGEIAGYGDTANPYILLPTSHTGKVGFVSPTSSVHYYQVFPIDTEGQAPCQGDSGGPLFYRSPDAEATEPDKVIGIASLGHGPVCIGGFIKVNYTPIGRNSSFVKRAMDEFCVPKIGGVFTAPAGQGLLKSKIAGTESASLPSISIPIGPNDIQVTAFANDGYRFVGWKSGPAVCPCIGSTEPTCTAPAGWENPNEGTMPGMSESIICLAEFEIKPTMLTTGALSPDVSTAPAPVIGPEPVSASSPSFGPALLPTQPTPTPSPSFGPALLPTMLPTY